MPLTEREFDLSDEYDRLDEKVAEHAERYSTAENGSDYQQVAAQQGRQAQDHRSGVAWALGFPDDPLPGSGWDVETVSFGAPTKGDVNRVNDAVESIDCNRQDAYVAVATVDAPFLEHDPNDIGQATLKRTIRAVADLHPDFVAWADSRIDSLSQGGDSGKSFMASVMEQTSANSQSESG